MILFQSVFKDEDLSSIPNLGVGIHLSTMPNIIFSTSGIQSLLNDLDTNKVCGPDWISPYILKHLAEEISPILQVIFTQSLDTGTLSSDWLSADIRPVLKKGCHSNPTNCRPISITSICCKTMEHIIYHSVMEHLQYNNILIDNQHGF